MVLDTLKKVEYGWESSFEILLQVWLLAPIYESLTNNSYLDLVQKGIQGLWSFLPFQSNDIKLEDISLGRLIIAVISLSFGEAWFKVTKLYANIKLEKKVFQALILFISTLCLTLLRIQSVKVLVLLDDVAIGVAVLMGHIVILIFLNVYSTWKSGQRILTQLPWIFLSALASTTSYIQFRKKIHQSSQIEYIVFYVLLFIEYLSLIILIPFLSSNPIFTKNCYATYESSKMFIFIFIMAVLLQVNLSLSQTTAILIWPFSGSLLQKIPFLETLDKIFWKSTWRGRWRWRVQVYIFITLGC